MAGRSTERPLIFSQYHGQNVLIKDGVVAKGRYVQAQGQFISLKPIKKGQTFHLEMHGSGVVKLDTFMSKSEAMNWVSSKRPLPKGCLRIKMKGRVHYKVKIPPPGKCLLLISQTGTYLLNTGPETTLAFDIEYGDVVVSIFDTSEKVTFDQICHSPFINMQCSPRASNASLIHYNPSSLCFIQNLHLSPGLALKMRANGFKTSDAGSYIRVCVAGMHNTYNNEGAFCCYGTESSPDYKGGRIKLTSDITEDFLVQVAETGITVKKITASGLKLMDELTVTITGDEAIWFEIHKVTMSLWQISDTDYLHMNVRPERLGHGRIFSQRQKPIEKSFVYSPLPLLPPTRKRRNSHEKYMHYEQSFQDLFASGQSIQKAGHTNHCSASSDVANGSSHNFTDNDMESALISYTHVKYPFEDLLGDGDYITVPNFTSCDEALRKLSFTKSAHSSSSSLSSNKNGSEKILSNESFYEEPGVIWSKRNDDSHIQVKHQVTSDTQVMIPKLPPKAMHNLLACKMPEKIQEPTWGETISSTQECSALHEGQSHSHKKYLEDDSKIINKREENQSHASVQMRHEKKEENLCAVNRHSESSSVWISDLEMQNFEMEHRLEIEFKPVQGQLRCGSTARTSEVISDCQDSLNPSPLGLRKFVNGETALKKCTRASKTPISDLYRLVSHSDMDAKCFTDMETPLKKVHSSGFEVQGCNSRGETSMVKKGQVSCDDLSSNFKKLEIGATILLPSATEKDAMNDTEDKTVCGFDIVVDEGAGGKLCENYPGDQCSLFECLVKEDDTLCKNPCLSDNDYEASENVDDESVCKYPWSANESDDTSEESEKMKLKKCDTLCASNEEDTIMKCSIYERNELNDCTLSSELEVVKREHGKMKRNIVVSAICNNVTANAEYPDCLPFKRSPTILRNLDHVPQPPWHKSSISKMKILNTDKETSINSLEANNLNSMRQYKTWETTGSDKLMAQRNSSKDPQIACTLHSYTVNRGPISI